MGLRLAKPFAASLLSVATAAVVAGVSCSATQPTELVPGVLTQLQVPRDLDGIEIEVQVNHTRVFCEPQYVDNGAVDLPTTLGVVSGTAPDTPITVIVRGFSDAQTNPSTTYGCYANPLPAGAANGPRVVRSSTQTYVAQQTLFLPMPLSYSCFDQDCSTLGDGFTCEGAQCVQQPAPELVASQLVDFDPTLIYGTGECFSPAACFPSQGTLTVQPVDPGRCIYAAPPGAGINVRVLYEDIAWIQGPVSGQLEEEITNASESEILDEDPNEGFCLGTCPTSAGLDAGTDAGNSIGTTDASETDGGVLPTFQLAPGLCNLVKAAHAPPPLSASAEPSHTIAQVELGLGCLTSKSPLLPICADERGNGVTLDGAVAEDAVAVSSDGEACNTRVPLTSTPSAVYLVMDNSVAMKGAFGPTGYATVMSLTLADPVFNETYAAFRFFPHTPDDGGPFDQSECTSLTTEFADPTVPFGLATTVQAQIASQVDNWTPPEGEDAGSASLAPLDLQAAMRPGSGTGAYSAVSSFLANREAPNIAAVMFFVNRTPTLASDAGSANDCDPPLYGTSAQASIEQEIEMAYQGSPSIRTYFVVLGNDSGDPGPLDFYKSLQADLPQMVTTIDATLPSTQAEQVLKNFSQAAEALGTCLYEPVSGIAEVDYADPSQPGTPISIDPNAACSEATQNTVNGWSLDQGRIRICGQACTDLQNAVLVASAAAQASQSPVPEVAVTGTILCGVTAPMNDGAVSIVGADAALATDAASVNEGAAASLDATANTMDASAGADGTTTAPTDGAGLDAIGLDDGD
jgi:hypothetical protein